MLLDEQVAMGRGVAWFGGSPCLQDATGHRVGNRPRVVGKSGGCRGRGPGRTHQSVTTMSGRNSSISSSQ